MLVSTCLITNSCQISGLSTAGVTLCALQRHMFFLLECCSVRMWMSHSSCDSASCVTFKLLQEQFVLSWNCIMHAAYPLKFFTISWHWTIYICTLVSTLIYTNINTSGNWPGPMFNMSKFSQGSYWAIDNTPSSDQPSAKRPKLALKDVSSFKKTAV